MYIYIIFFSGGSTYGAIIAATGPIAAGGGRGRSRQPDMGWWLWVEIYNKYLRQYRLRLCRRRQCRPWDRYRGGGKTTAETTTTTAMGSGDGSTTFGVD